MTQSTIEPMTEEQSDIVSARYVLQHEIEGLQALNSYLGKEFIAAVDLVAATQGRLIISGMGKSGHVARKIAATMASTGTPSYFVHPGEASHGDLGMITQQDCVMLLSNSGETTELGDMIAYCSRFSIPLIGVVRRASSTLVEEATVALVLPATAEASPTGAPTTSTTMMMALGDAMAIALLQRRGFTPEEFHVYHPGGKLGQAFTRVSSLMHKHEEMPLTAPQAAMSEVLITMTAKRFGCAGVIENNTLIGVVTDGDLRRHLSDALMSLTAREVMTPNPVVTTPNTLATEALQIMNSKSITCLFVVDDNKKPVGIVHIHDCLRAGIR
ncbi:MAG: KpsF/GutQ family sugar-phosphate isomerase [Alphaproteobacteria bacterium]|nr:KpsF/GutQ family sugar-phosphate isomerase [Alphaproteobacteria bacterium]